MNSGTCTSGETPRTELPVSWRCRVMGGGTASSSLGEESSSRSVVDSGGWFECRWQNRKNLIFVSTSKRLYHERAPTPIPRDRSSALLPGPHPGGQTSSKSKAGSWSRVATASYTQISEYLGLISTSFPTHSGRGSLRDLLNHLTSSSREPEIALPVISRSRILSSSSMAASELRSICPLA